MSTTTNGTPENYIDATKKIRRIDEENPAAGKDSIISEKQGKDAGMSVNSMQTIDLPETGSHGKEESEKIVSFSNASSRRTAAGKSSAKRKSAGRESEEGKAASAKRPSEKVSSDSGTASSYDIKVDLGKDSSRPAADRKNLNVPRTRKPLPVMEGSFLAVILLSCQLLEFIYRIPVVNVIGDIGGNFFGCAFDIFNVFLIITSFVVMNPMASIITERMEKGREKTAMRLFQAGLIFFTVLSAIGALFIVFASKLLVSNMMNTPYSIFSLKVLAPALVSFALLALVRGFLIGIGHGREVVWSFLIQKVTETLVAIWATYYLYRYGVTIGTVLADVEHYSSAFASAGRAWGITLGSVAALLFTLGVYLKNKRRFEKKMAKDRSHIHIPFSRSVQIIMLTASGTMICQLILAFDTLFIQGVFKSVAHLQGYNDSVISNRWGIYEGKYLLMLVIPMAIALAAGAGGSSYISLNYRKNDLHTVRTAIERSVRMVMVNVISIMIGTAVMAKPLFTMLFPALLENLDVSVKVLLVGAPGIVLWAGYSVLHSCLHAIGQYREPNRNALLAFIAQVVAMIMMMLFLRLNIYAVVASSELFALLMCYFDLRSLTSYCGYKQKIVRTFLLPIVNSAITAAAAYGVYYVFYQSMENNTVVVLISFFTGICIYPILTLLTRTVREEDLAVLPKGKVMIKIAHKLHLI